MEYSDGVFDCCFCGNSLNGLDDDSFGFLVGCQLGVVHNIINIRGSLGFGFLFQRFHQTFFCFLGRQTGQCFQFFAFLHLQFVQFFFLLVYNHNLRFQVFLDSFSFCTFALYFFLFLIQHQFALFQFVFGLLDFLVAQCNLFFQIRLFI